MKLTKGQHNIETAVIILLFVGELIVAGCGNNPVSSPGGSTQPQYTAIYKVLFPTADDVTIAASWSIPPNVQGNIPVVILIHHFQNSDHLYDDRTQWFGFFDDLLSQGYGVLAIDLRGHGESSFGADLGTIQGLERMIFDVEAAISWLKLQKNIDTSRIAVIGGNIGANIAYVSSGAFREVRTAIVLSPLITNPPTLIGTDISRFAPHSILFMAADGDERAVAAVNQLSQRTATPKRVEILKDSEDWGMELIAFHSEERELAIAWLKETL